MKQVSSAKIESDDGKKSTMSQVCQPDKDKLNTTKSNAEGPRHETTGHKSGAVKSKVTPPVKSLGTGKNMQKSGSGKCAQLLDTH